MEKIFTIGDTLNNDNKVFVYKIELEGIKKVTSISVSSSNVDVIYLDYKISEDGYTYSYWKELLPDSLASKELPSNTYLKIRASLNGSGESTIDSIKITYEDSCNDKLEIKPLQPSSSIQVQKPTYNFLEKPTMLADLNQKVAKGAAMLAGIDCLYFKAEALEVDMILHEYTMLELSQEKAKKVKIVFPDNEMPEKPIITPFGTTFENPIEVHIDFTYFQDIFGKDAEPKAGDIIYAPITKAIWEVQSTWLVRGIMNSPIYWQLMLAKYQPKASRLEGNLDNGSLVDMFKDKGLSVMSAEDLLEQPINDEGRKVVKPELTQGAEQTFGLDFYRHNSIKVAEESIENGFIVVSHFSYDLSSIPYNETALSYRLSKPLENEYSFSAWINPANDIHRPILIKVANNSIISSRLSGDGSFFLEAKDGSGFYAVEVASKAIANVQVPDGLYYAAEKSYQNIFNGWNILNNKFIANEQLTIYEPIPDLEPSKWYNIIITASNRFEQIGLFIYGLSIHGDDLNTIFSKTLSASSIEMPSSLTIKAGLNKITNIRLFNEMLQEEHHNIILNQQLVNDADKAVVMDNAKPLYKQEYFGKPL